jgi:hypothetical protein
MNATLSVTTEDLAKDLSRDTVIKGLRAALKARTGLTWSVTGGRGTAWGWIRVSAPPKRMEGYLMSQEDQEILSGAMDLGTYSLRQGYSIADQSDARLDVLQRANGLAPSGWTRGWD